MIAVPGRQISQFYCVERRVHGRVAATVGCHARGPQVFEGRRIQRFLSSATAVTEMACRLATTDDARPEPSQYIRGQKRNFKASWITRGSKAAWIWLNVGELISLSGKRKFGWFKMLKNSARNWMFFDSVTRKFLKTEKSQLE